MNKCCFPSISCELMLLVINIKSIFPFISVFICFSTHQVSYPFRFTFFQLEVLNVVEKELKSETDTQWNLLCTGSNHLYDLLASLQTHLLAYCVNNPQQVKNSLSKFLFYIHLYFRGRWRNNLCLKTQCFKAKVLKLSL